MAPSGRRSPVRPVKMIVRAMEKQNLGLGLELELELELGLEL